MDLNENVKTIKGIGDKTAGLLEKLGIFTAGDLICHYPRDYERFDEPVRIKDLKPGGIYAVDLGISSGPVQKQARRLKILNLNTGDGSGRLTLTWFNSPYMARILRPGLRFVFRGRISSFGDKLVMEQPRVYRRDEYAKLMREYKPVYHLTEGLKGGVISKAVRTVLESTDEIKDPMSAADRKSLDLMSMKEAMYLIHFPKDQDSLLRARRRIVFDEFAGFMSMLHAMKSDRSGNLNSFNIVDTGIVRAYTEKLPYDLTEDQTKAVEDILRDLGGRYVMNRLLEGDVGSGKTIVSVLAMLAVCDCGYQCALMAPTEVLARQHFEGISRVAESFGKKAVLLVGSMKAAEKKKSLQALSSGTADIAIGTHALISQNVEFKDLALVITDEQHRFGVRQRELLSKKGNMPHTLVMSATPIPRSLAMILYGDLDISVLKTLPSGRKKIKNCVVNESYRPTANRFILSQVSDGRQCYIVCPAVEEDEDGGLNGVIVYSEKLREEIGDRVRIECIYGRMKGPEKTDIMERFSRGEIDVLVSTTVIEVGINVPNATVMLVEDADRFGLATLHQLRGRVGRGKHQSYCIFMSSNESDTAKERLEVMNRSNDGFFIAEEDLRLRGPGDMFGIRQSGELNFRLADIYNDSAILKEAAEYVKKLEEKGGRYPQFRTFQSDFNVVL